MADTTTPRPRPRRATTPLGPVAIVDEVAIPSALRDGDEVVLQHLAADAGPLLRLGYRRADRMLRGPITLTPAELDELHVLRESNTQAS